MDPQIEVTPQNTIKDLPLWRIAGWGFVLNMLWEFGQCTILYNMWSWGFWRGSTWMWGAIIGDVGIVMLILGLSVAIRGASRLNPPDTAGWITLILVSFSASIFFEWMAQYLALWTYSPLMPTWEIRGFMVGLTPIVQITILPPLSVLIAFHQVRKLTANRADIQ